MRLWSLHPEYLDPAGLVALWREGFLAQAVLAGETRGYRSHPQLERFRAHARPRAAIAAYLHDIADEAERRGYSFDRTKLARRSDCSLTVTRGQLRYEREHLLRKLLARNPTWCAALEHRVTPLPHPLFVVVAGGVAEWERR